MEAKDLKYEIITSNGKKQVRALRQFECQGRLVRVGDLGGYVADADTLSQYGTCWLFSGSFNARGAHINDDAMVDIGVGSTEGILNRINVGGTSQIVGACTFVSVHENCTINIVNSRIIVAYQVPSVTLANAVMFNVVQSNGTIEFQNSELMVTVRGDKPKTVALACKLFNSTMYAASLGMEDPTILGRYTDCKNVQCALDALTGVYTEDKPRIIATRVVNMYADNHTMPNISDFMNTPLVLTDCVIEEAIFRANPVCNNVYSDLTFKSGENSDLGSVTGNYTLVSSEQQGCYRLWDTKANVMSGLVSGLSNLSGDVTVSTTGVHITGEASVVASGAGTVALSGEVFIRGKAQVTATAGVVTIKGNVTIEDSAVLADSSVQGTCYMGDRATIRKVNFIGCLNMRENASIISLAALQMTQVVLNARLCGNAAISIAADYARPISTHIVMSGNTTLGISGTADLHSGLLTMRDNAKAGAMGVAGKLTIVDEAFVSGGVVSGEVLVSGLFRGELGNVVDKRSIGNIAEVTAQQPAPTHYDF